MKFKPSTIAAIIAVIALIAALYFTQKETRDIYDYEPEQEPEPEPEPEPVSKRKKKIEEPVNPEENAASPDKEKT